MAVASNSLIVFLVGVIAFLLYSANNNTNPLHLLLGNQKPVVTVSDSDDCYSDLSSFAVYKTEDYFLHSVQLTSSQYNLPDKLPNYVVLPGNVSELQKAMRCATQKKLPVSIKCGGHNYAGFSRGNNTGFLIYMRKFNQISDPFIYTSSSYNGPAIHFGAGNRFGDIYSLLDSNFTDYILSAGLCPTVGVGGYYLGGGIGAANRQFCYGVDQVLEIEMVTMNGTFLKANERENSELFWALRGGGGPSFGVVVSYTVKLQKASKNYSYGAICVGSPTETENITAILNRLAVRTRTNDFPNWMEVDWRLNKNNGLCFIVYSLKDRSETLNELNDILLDYFPNLHNLKCNPGNPPKFRKGHYSYRASGLPRTENFSFFCNFKSFYKMELANAKYKGYAEFNANPDTTQSCVLGNLEPNLTTRIVEHYKKIPSSGCSIQGMVLGGSECVAPKIPVDKTAFPFREAGYASDCSCEYIDKESQNKAEKYTRDYVDIITKEYSKGWYLNFPNPQSPPDYPNLYWTTNLRKLKQIRQKYNPQIDYILKFPQEVPLP